MLGEECRRASAKQEDPRSKPVGIDNVLKPATVSMQAAVYRAICDAADNAGGEVPENNKRGWW